MVVIVEESEVGWYFLVMSPVRSYRASQLFQRTRMQSIVHAFSKFFDSTDPFRPYTWRLAKTFVSKEPKAVIAAQSVILVERDYMRKPQGLFIQQLLRQQPWVHEIAEIGFNAGHASWIFLCSRPDVKV